MHIRASILCTIVSLNFISCHEATSEKPGNKPDSSAVSATDLAVAENSFLFDLNFLKDHDSSFVVLETGRSKIIVSPKYQGKVFTSTADGDSGTSFGWVHYKSFDAPPDQHINAYGGENRVWIGPEGGKFSVFFPKDSAMIFNNWKTPAAFDTEPWTITAKSATAVSLLKDNVQLENYAGTRLSFGVIRNIKILDEEQIKAAVGLDSGYAAQMVGYLTENILVNNGQAWTKTTGAPCLWMLDMFNPSDNATIVIPYKDAADKPATTDYFGEIPADRIAYKYNRVFFKADGKSRGKLGIHPARAMNVAGSYDAEKKILTVTIFDVDNKAKYLNQEWRTDKPAFSGDAVNAYNDGPLATGGQLGPFYEIESVAPTVFLKPHTSTTHHHSVFHFTGDEQSLDKIAQRTLGVTLEQIKSALH